MGLRSITVLLVCMVVILSLLLTDLLVSSSIGKNIRDQQAEKARTIATIISESTNVKEGLETKTPQSIQEFTKRIREKSSVLFIVVMDMNGIRQSHPDPKKIGKRFAGGDEQKSLHGKSYVSVSKGTLDKSLRAFAPIYNEKNQQIGAVAVGISLNNVNEAIRDGHRRIVLGSLIGLLVGVLGAILLANYIKKILFGLEPSEIAKILEERSTMLQSVREGVIAVDKEGNITLANRSARRLFVKAGLESEPIGLSIREYMPTSRLDDVLSTGESHYDEEQVINGVAIVVNRVPLVVNEEIVGALSTFRDKTEVNILAEQLTGVKMYVEALRAQSHEFMNKLHVILGMVQMNYYDELKTYIHQLVNHRVDESSSVTKSIKDHALAGFLMGKMSYAREESVELTFSADEVIPEPSDPHVTHHLITIIGNLIDNAIDSVCHQASKKVSVMLVYKNNKLTIQVTDTGCGIPSDTMNQIFKKGFSTKGTSRGFGLHLVKQTIDELGGQIVIDSFINSGTTFYIDIPYETRRDQVD
ncbi:MULTISPECIES: DcuS/MalK family sensor histidine kinase [Priestia]|uniref:DcuS/MalK family sensor histidine kinase n=1 Tax=Priestia TaxID=2800373 RepID=UPI0015F8BC07|nr:MULTISPECIES: DcuS/MalK family sensor histidine kinase [Priestia]MED5242664.1 DcuS/MalK family sensor histidine kinase [Priestia sp. LL-8]